ncbi:hypothetical protein [Prosthecobacter sp.]|uniref:hypothetical protein n=1 Tax=Prosthecobacter sp. TaxID=1965333 RepID=UPI003783BA15
MNDISGFKFQKVFHRKGAEECTDLIISVHGMGDQFRNDMTHTVASLFAETYVKDPFLKQAIRLPQGLWEGEKTHQPECDDVISYAPLEGEVKKQKENNQTPTLAELGKLGFAEIYWADMPRVAERDAHRLEYSPQWAGSVVDRLRQRNDLENGFSGPELTLGATVLEEVAESMKILQNLFFLTDKAGMFTFDLGNIMAQYLGDVQQVADFRYVREEIIKRFAVRVAYLAAKCPRANLHFVAHSEGTVLTFFTLLTAMNKAVLSEDPFKEPFKDCAGWISRVRSLTTFGSPIDKHLLLWPEMWGRLSDGEEKARAAMNAFDEAKEKCTKTRSGCAACKDECDVCSAASEVFRQALHEQHQKWHVPAGHKIRWRNYYDKADPVGFDLDTAREKLLLWGCQAFEFTQHDDFGFRRYILAGKAHVDYFGDSQLFEHIRDSAVFGRTSKIVPQDTWYGKTSPVWPFAIVAALHLVAVFILHQSLSPGTHANPGFVWPFASAGLVRWAGSLAGVVGGAAMMLAVTIFTRSARIAGIPNALFGWPMVYTGLCVGVLAGTFYKQSSFIGMNWAGFTWVLLAGVLASLLTLLLDFTLKHFGKSPVWGLRVQMIFGGGTVALSVMSLLKSPEASLLKASMGAAAFLYLWWLGVLLFDLSYVWKRYINTARENTFAEKLRRRIHGRVKMTGPHAHRPA